MQAGWKIGSLFGIPLFVDSSWFVILALATFDNARNYQAYGLVISWVAGFALALLLFGSVLLHELGHSLTAMSQGIKVNSITLFLFGGIAAIDRESKTPGQAFQVAIAGPAVSFGLFVIVGLAGYAIPQSNLLHAMAEEISRINLVLGIFNLIPGLPLDGGQVLKAAVWKISGSRIVGVHWAAKTGQFLGWMAVALGAALFLLSQQYGALWIALIGWFCVQNASSYNRIADLQGALLKIKAGDAMSREFRLIDGDLTLRQFAEQYLLETSHLQIYVAAVNGRDRGLVSVDDIRFTERSQWDKQTLKDIVKPLGEAIAVGEKTSLVEVINCMESNQLRRIVVLSPTGSVAGTIDKGDIVRALAKHLNVRITEADIKRIKEDGNYPPGLPLNAIAKATDHN
ncbi:Zn-dependent protease [Oscillatoriales cyanobacterium USR001]|nr:Zn-dependent protease [Oscillatoriales cyanobacterium USR001]